MDNFREPSLEERVDAAATETTCAWKELESTRRNNPAHPAVRAKTTKNEVETYQKLQKKLEKEQPPGNGRHVRNGISDWLHQKMVQSAIISLLALFAMIAQVGSAYVIFNKELAIDQHVVNVLSKQWTTAEQVWIMSAAALSAIIIVVTLCMHLCMGWRDHTAAVPNNEPAINGDGTAPTGDEGGGDDQDGSGSCI